MADAVKDAIEVVHAALDNDNAELDPAIANLKKALAEKGEKFALFDRTRLPQNNRQGRKMMQTYFRKRGVEVEFTE